MQQQSNVDLSRRISELEKDLRDEKAALQPLVNLYNAGSLIGKIMIISCGAVVGAVTIWSSISGYIGAHWK